jgi:putative serine protease PepD
VATPSQRPRRVTLWAVALLVLVAAGAAGAIIANAVGNNSNSTATAGATGSTCNVTSVAQEQLPTVVTIQVKSANGGGVGSGEVIRSDGYVLTNNHVIAAAAASGTVQVVFDDGRTEQASIVGRDPLTDLAVIRIAGASGLKTITMGNSADLRIGQPVIVLGAPLGLSNTVTSGIVSALGRTVNVPGEGSQAAILIDAVQTDAAINPGNSGGAMVNCQGALVGIPTAGAAVPSASGEAAGGSIGLGFAIPVNFATEIAHEIISTGRATHAFLGLAAQSISADDGQTGAAEGLWVTSVDPGGPAAVAGLQQGDIIRTIDGAPAASVDQLTVLTLAKRAGDKVELAYERAGRRGTATLTLTSRVV